MHNLATDLSTIYSLVDQGGEDLLTDEERAQLPAKRVKARKPKFQENLAEVLDDTTLGNIAEDVVLGYNEDEASRQDWRAREKLGIRLLGISENADGLPAFENASVAVHPGLIEAVIQFQARAISELWPPEGPAKAFVEGQAANYERELQAQRVADYLNWLYTSRMPGGYLNHDRLLMRLPLSGSVFKKVFYDPLARTIVSRYVAAEDLVIPYGATDLLTVPRATHIIPYTETDLRRLIEAGTYRDIDIDTLSYQDEKTELQPELDAVSSTKPTGIRLKNAGRFVFLEQSAFLDIDGEPENSPYLVTVDRDSMQVFSIYRDWRKADKYRTRRQRFIHYYFLPGLDGFYGLGLLHILGRLAEALSGNLRALLDSATLANLQGGFRSADVKLPRGNRGEDLMIRPGAWPAVEATVDDLNKLFFKIPYKEPSQTLFNLLQYLDEVFRRIATTSTELVGEGTKPVPVGTTLARIEQGLKVQSGIQIRCHHAQAQELVLVCELTSETLPDEGYCRDVLNTTPDVFAADFDARVDVRPVSDPNAITSTQRLVIAQATVDMANQSPDIVDRREAYKRLMEAMRQQDIELLLPDKAKVERMGPIEENMAMMIMKPVKSYPDQDHTAHIAVHQPWFMGLDTETQTRLQGAAMAHMAEHQAWMYQIQMQQMLGIQLPAPGEASQMDPQMENQLAAMAAQASQLMAQYQASQPPPADPNAIIADGKVQAERQKAEADIRRKDALASASMARDSATTIARLNQDAAQHEANLLSKYMSAEASKALTQAQIDAKSKTQ